MVGQFSALLFKRRTPVGLVFAAAASAAWTVVAAFLGVAVLVVGSLVSVAGAAALTARDLGVVAGAAAWGVYCVPYACWGAVGISNVLGCAAAAIATGIVAARTGRPLLDDEPTLSFDLFEVPPAQ